MTKTTDTAAFIAAHIDEDVRRLALKYQGTEGVDLKFALQQIAGRQTARRKLPSWAATEGLTYPPHLSMEQCSSEQTARYKASVARRIAEQAVAENGGGTVLTDLTGGLGVDFSFMAREFGRAVYVERDAHLCAIAGDNFRRLGLDNACTVCADCTDYLPGSGRVTLFYADPARRDSNGARTYAISDCTPDIVRMMPVMLGKAEAVMVKLSPMLDISQTIREVEQGGEARVSEVHIVSAGNECKEMLVVIRRGGSGGLRGALFRLLLAAALLFGLDALRLLLARLFKRTLHFGADFLKGGPQGTIGHTGLRKRDRTSQGIRSSG